MSVSWILYNISQIVVLAPVIVAIVLIIRRVRTGVTLSLEQEPYNSCLAWILNFLLSIFKPNVLFILAEGVCLIIASQITMIAGMVE